MLQYCLWSTGRVGRTVRSQKWTREHLWFRIYKCSRTHWPNSECNIREKNRQTSLARVQIHTYIGLYAAGSDHVSDNSAELQNVTDVTAVFRFSLRAARVHTHNTFIHDATCKRHVEKGLTLLIGLCIVKWLWYVWRPHVRRKCASVKMRFSTNIMIILDRLKMAHNLAQSKLFWELKQFWPHRTITRFSNFPWILLPESRHALIDAVGNVAIKGKKYYRNAFCLHVAVNCMK